MHHDYFKVFIDTEHVLINFQFGIYGVSLIVSIFRWV